MLTVMFIVLFVVSLGIAITVGLDERKRRKTRH